VLASQSHGGLGELLIGSVATYLIHATTRPVAVLHMKRSKGDATGGAAAAAVPEESAGDRTEGPAQGEAKERLGRGTVVASAVGEDVSALGKPNTLCGRSILVPVDGSEDSVASCRWAIDNLYRKGE
jgi:hypothetical protein